MSKKKNKDKNLVFIIVVVLIISVIGSTKLVFSIIIPNMAKEKIPTPARMPNFQPKHLTA